MNFKSMNLEEFSKELASNSPAPGGGSCAALAGALAASLASMVARLTVGRKKYEASWESMENVLARGDEAAAALLDLVEKDSQSYDQVTEAFKLPKETDEEKAARSKAVQEAFKGAAQTPLDTLETVAGLTTIVKDALEKGNPNCITDAGVAAQLIRAAAMGAAYNVRINIGSIKDEAFVNQLTEKTGALLQKVHADVAELEELMEKGLG